MKRLIIIIVVAFVFMGGSGCFWMLYADTNSKRGGDWPALGEKPAIAVSMEDMRELADADNEFAFKLNKNLMMQGKDRNVLFSPLSIAMVLDMLYNGAEGNTKQAMTATLALPLWDMATLNRANHGLMTQLMWADSDTWLSIANSLWLGTELTVKKSYIDQVKAPYKAEVKNVDFRAASTPGEINAWVSEHTNGRINEIVGSFPTNTLMYAANAVYFNGVWTFEFKESNTKKAPFALADGKTKDVDMMLGVAPYGYAEEKGKWQMVEMSYGKGGLSMFVVLPAATSSLAAFCEALTAESWKAMCTQMSPSEVTLRLPRFKYQYAVELSNTLSAMGMGAAFDPEAASFSKLANVQAWLNRFDHKALIEVDEHGARAAAASGGGWGCAMPLQKATMTIDRPFLFAIAEAHTGVILMMGSVYDPK